MNRPLLALPGKQASPQKGLKVPRNANISQRNSEMKAGENNADIPHKQHQSSLSQHQNY